MRRQDAESGVANVVGSILVLAGLVVLLAVYNVQWHPTQVANKEGDRSQQSREQLAAWASTAEEFLLRGLTNASFSRPVTVGTGSTGPFALGASTGTVTLATTPTLTVFRGTTQVASLSGGVSVESRFTKFPIQTLRYHAGVLEVTQDADTWVDLRSLLTVQRGSLGTLTATVQAFAITGGPLSQGGAKTVDVAGTFTSASSSTQAAANVRLLADGVSTNGWKAAVERTLGTQGLTGTTAADCTAQTTHFCYDSDTTDSDTLDLYLLNVGADWTLRTGSLRAELRS